MNRRSIISVAGGVTLGATLPVLGQSPQKVWRIGVLSLYVRRDVFIVLPALRQLGYEEPKNVIFDYRFADGKDDQLSSLAAELVAQKVDLILAVTSSESHAAKRATTTIPIVVAAAGADPVESGLVASLAHPGANITGVTGQPPEPTARFFSCCAIPWAD